MAKPNQCTKYTKATAEIYFPGGNVCCDLCPLMETYARKQCRRTGEYLVDSRVPGAWCPLNYEGKEDNNWESLC